MDRMVLSLVILFFHCVHGDPQTREMFYRKTTTQDPIDQFFSSCNPRIAACVQKHVCATENILKTNNCDGASQVCCKLDDRPIVFLDYTSSRPARTTKTTTARPRTTEPTTLKPTTTEESSDNWSAKDCGIRNSNKTYSVDIRDSEKNEFPWNVEIFSEQENSFGFKQNVFHCGGTLIDDFVVITSANCESLRNNTELFVAAGVWNINDPEEKRQIRKVNTIFKHPDYRQGAKKASIAFLVLDDKLDLTQWINRICLPEPDIDFSQSMCFVTGWGSHGQTIRSHIKVVEMQMIEHNKCEQNLKEKHLTNHLERGFQCAKENKNNQICQFDIGSPLFCTIPGRLNQFYQVGIFVWNEFLHNNRACGGDKARTVNLFVKIQHFKKWIDYLMEEIDRGNNVYTPQPAYDDYEE